MSGSTDVLICGAGATGLTLAIELARRGVPFRLVDRLDGPFQGSRGKGIQPRSQEIFEDLGVLDRLFAIGGVYPPARSHRGDGQWSERPIVEPAAPSPAEPYRQGLMVPQFLTESVLRERLAELGHRVAYGHELRGFEQDDEGVSATLGTREGEHAIRARYLVGADGGRSRVRGTSGIDFPGKTLGLRAVVADLELDGLERSAWHQFNEASPTQRLSLCPLAGTALFQLQAPVPLEGDVDLSPAGLGTLVQSRTGRADLRIGAVHWASAYHMHARLADRYRAGRVFLAGDAAHAHPPTGGQGLNTSVQDAYNLGWKLATVLAGAPASLLDSYEQERRPIAEAMLGLSTSLLDAAQRGEFKRGREVQQLDLAYPGSALSLEAPPRSQGLRAGDRAPDAVLRGAGGQARRLFDLFKGTHWTLLGHQPAVPMHRTLHNVEVHLVGPYGELRDEQGQFAAAYGSAPDTWWLVRPDGHVGAIVATSELDRLIAHLEAIVR